MLHKAYLSALVTDGYETVRGCELRIKLSSLIR